MNICKAKTDATNALHNVHVNYLQRNYMYMHVHVL